MKFNEFFEILVFSRENWKKRKEREKIWEKPRFWRLSRQNKESCFHLLLSEEHYSWDEFLLCFHNLDIKHKSLVWRFWIAFLHRQAFGCIAFRHINTHFGLAIFEEITTKTILRRSYSVPDLIQIAGST